MDYLRISMWSVLFAVVVSVHGAPFPGGHHQSLRLRALRLARARKAEAHRIKRVLPPPRLLHKTLRRLGPLARSNPRLRHLYGDVKLLVHLASPKRHRPRPKRHRPPQQHPWPAPGYPFPFYLLPVPYPLYYPAAPFYPLPAPAYYQPPQYPPPAHHHHPPPRHHPPQDALDPSYDPSYDPPPPPRRKRRPRRPKSSRPVNIHYHLHESTPAPTRPTPSCRPATRNPKPDCPRHCRHDRHDHHDSSPRSPPPDYGHTEHRGHYRDSSDPAPRSPTPDYDHTDHRGHYRYDDSLCRHCPGWEGGVVEHPDAAEPCDPNPAPPACSTHTIIHVPTRVHTVHHHHVKKVKVPVYVSHKHTHVHHTPKVTKVKNHYYDLHHHEEEADAGDEYEDEVQSWHSRRDGPSIGPGGPGGDDAEVDEHYDDQPFIDSLEIGNDFEDPDGPPGHPHY